MRNGEEVSVLSLGARFLYSHTRKKTKRGKGTNGNSSIKGKPPRSEVEKCSM